MNDTVIIRVCFFTLQMQNSALPFLSQNMKKVSKRFLTVYVHILRLHVNRSTTAKRDLRLHVRTRHKLFCMFLVFL